MPDFPNNVSLRQLRAFAEVAECASFAAAARRLFITQSALSESIRLLEEAVGLRLLDRTTRSVALTAAGTVFLEEVQQALATLTQGVRRMADLASLQGGEVRVVAAPSVLAVLVMPCLPALRARYPGLKVMLHEEGGEAVLRAVREGQADFGVGGWHASAAHLDAEALLRDRMGWLARPDDPLLAKPGLSAADLAGQALVGYTTDTAIHALLSAEPSLPESVLAPTLRVSNTVLLQQAIALGLGGAVVPALIACHPLLQGLGFRPLAAPLIERQVMVFQRPRRSLSPAAEVFKAALVQQARTLQGQPGIEAVAR